MPSAWKFLSSGGRMLTGYKLKMKNHLLPLGSLIIRLLDFQMMMLKFLFNQQKFLLLHTF